MTARREKTTARDDAEAAGRKPVMPRPRQDPAPRTGDPVPPCRDKPAVSIVIVTHDTCSLLLACLDSIEAAAGRTAHEVIVVDNGSSDGSARAIRETHPDIRLIETEENLGFGRAANRGARQSRADIVLFLNSDTLLQQGCLEALLELFRRHPRAAAAGPRLLDPDGRTQHSIYRTPCKRAFLYSETLLGKLGLFRRAFEHYQYRDFDPGREQRVEHAKGAALAVRRSVLREVGGFDPRFFMYYEDLDLNRRIRQAGREIWYCVEARVTHAGKKTARQDWPRAFLASRESLLAYLAKYESAASMRWFKAAFRPLAFADDLVTLLIATLKWLLAHRSDPAPARRYRAAMAARLAALTPSSRGKKVRRG